MQMAPPEAPAPPLPVAGYSVQPEIRSATPERISGLQVTDGFTVSVFGEGLGSVRMMAEADDGTIYVTRRSEGDVLALRDDNDDGMTMVFYTGEQFPEEYRNDAFVAMRGSWNRQEPVGYKVVHIDFDENREPTAIEDFITGWLLKEEVAQFGRVAGLLVLSDSSVLLSEDTNGVIYQIRYTRDEE